ncbi:MAG: fumarate hydratase, partial [Candidatus Lokiarchaeota archaeon]|nr:fumarate hydratase [Candidatus Lokiarchaeota archaeon]
LNLILKNLAYGKQHKLPICQDTGMINILIEFSPKVRFPDTFVQNIYTTIQEATNIIPLRPNTVDPLSGKNVGNNLGHDSPPIYFELSNEVDFIRITIMNKGGGSENMSELFMMNASSEIKDIKDNILQLVKTAGGKPCPPIILGIGIGGDALKCMYLAKKALMRPLFSRSQRIDVKKIEEDLIHEINELNIGPMGLGGSTTCLDVRIEWAMRHPASYPVGVIVQCYSHRVTVINISEIGKVLYQNH